MFSRKLVDRELSEEKIIHYYSKLFTGVLSEHAHPGMVACPCSRRQRPAAEAEPLVAERPREVRHGADNAGKDCEFLPKDSFSAVLKVLTMQASLRSASRDLQDVHHALVFFCANAHEPTRESHEKAHTRGLRNRVLAEQKSRRFCRFQDCTF